MCSKNELRAKINLIRGFSIDNMIKKTLCSWPDIGKKQAGIRKEYNQINEDITNISKLMEEQMGASHELG